MRREMRSTVVTVGADRRGCFSCAPSVARARGAGCRGTEERPCSAGARGGAGVASSRRWGCGRQGRHFGRLHRPQGVRCAGTCADGRCRGATVRRFGWLHQPLWGEVRETCADCLRGGVHGVAASGRRGRRFGRLHRPRGVEVCRTCVGGRGIDVHRAAGAGASAGVSVSQKRSRSNRSASASSPPASARARAWSTS